MYLKYFSFVFYEVTVKVTDFNPFSHSGHCIGLYRPKFQFHFKKGSLKNSYERRAYESVDDKNLS